MYNVNLFDFMCFQTEKESFDPLTEHRYWCAWITDISQQKQYMSISPLNTSLNTSIGDSVVDTQDNLIKQKPWISVLKILCPTVFSEEMDITISQQFKQVKFKIYQYCVQKCTIN